MGFNEFIKAGKPLSEARVRSDTFAKKVNDATAEARKADREFEKAAELLGRPVADNTDAARQERIRQVLRHFATGLRHQSRQIDHATSMTRLNQLMRDRILKDLLRKLDGRGSTGRRK